MLFNVAGLTVDMLLVKKSLNVGYCCAYMYIQHTNFEGGGRDSCGAGEDPPHPPSLALYRKMLYSRWM